MTAARYIKDLDTDELIKRLLGYSNLEGRCIRELKERHEFTDEVALAAQGEYIDAQDPGLTEDDSSALEWIRFIMSESFHPVFEDPEEELDRLKRYLVTASLVAAEARTLDEYDDEE